MNDATLAIPNEDGVYIVLVKDGVYASVILQDLTLLRGEHASAILDELEAGIRFNTVECSCD